MSIEYKATIYYGFELMENWNETVDEEFFDEYIDYFIDPDPCGMCAGPVLFAIEVKNIYEGNYVEINMEEPYVLVKDRQILKEFETKYPEARVRAVPKYYLMCRN